MKINVKVEGQSFEVQVGDLNSRPILVTVDGECFEVWPEELTPAAETPVKLAAAAMPVVPAAPVISGASTINKAKAVTAPIPGVIISVLVKEGDQVEVGQELCVLEAMKMKNSIRANRAGKIAAVRVAAGDQVHHSQVLIEFAD